MSISSSGATRSLVFNVHGDLNGTVAHHFRDPLVQSAHPTFVGVLGTDLLQCLLGDLDLFFRDARLLDVLLDEVSLGDLDLLLNGVARHLNDLHAVAQRGLNGGQ